MRKNAIDKLFRKIVENINNINNFEPRCVGGVAALGATIYMLHDVSLQVTIVG